MSSSLVLVDDPTRRVPFDLVHTLSGCSARLEWLVEPVAETAAADAASAGDALAAACATTAGSPVVLPRYRARGAGGSRRTPAEFAAGEAAGALVRLAPAPFVLVVFVSRSTLPLVEALHADPRTRALLRIGITGWRLDPDYNLAQKLVAQGKLDYHEHAMTLERTFCHRLGRMLQAHAARDRTAGTTPAAPVLEDAPPDASGRPAGPPSAAGPPAPAEPPSGRGPVSASA